MLVNLFVTLSRYIQLHKKKEQNKFLCHLGSFTSFLWAISPRQIKGCITCSLSPFEYLVFYISASDVALLKL